jgi:hypothetical protein
VFFNELDATSLVMSRPLDLSGRRFDFATRDSGVATLVVMSERPRGEGGRGI